jgi:hypothetical protein
MYPVPIPTRMKGASKKTGEISVNGSAAFWVPLSKFSGKLKTMIINRQPLRDYNKSLLVSLAMQFGKLILYLSINEKSKSHLLNRLIFSTQHTQEFEVNEECRSWAFG